MAYAPDPNNQNAPQELVDPTKQQPVTSSTGGGSAAGATPQGATAVPNATKAPPVQDLKAYLTANAPQAVQMGQSIANNLNEQGQQVVGDINSAQEGVDAQIQGASVAPNADLVSRAASNPTDFIKNSNDVNAFTGQRDAAYTGPTAFEQTPEFTAINSEVNNAVNATPDINKPGGVATLVRGQETNPTLGMQNLDELLLQGNPDAIAPIQSALPQFQTFAPQLSAAAATENAAIQKANADAAAARAGVQDKFLTGTDAIAPGFKTALNTRLGTSSDQTKKFNDDLNNLITLENNANPKISDLDKAIAAYNDDLKSQMGVVGDTIPGAPNSSILQRGDLAKNPEAMAQPTLAGVATPEDVQMENALEALLGSSYSPAFTTTGATPYKVPGSAPTIQDIINPALASLKSQLPGLNRSFVDAANGPAGAADKVEQAYQALLNYLGETEPTITPNDSKGSLGFRSGSSYVNPATGKIGTAV